MYVVGSDLLEVQGESAAPAGRQHAVTLDGRVLCRTSRAKFSWPALRWDPSADSDICPLCVQVHRAELAFSAPPAYPDEAVVPVQERHADADEPPSTDAVTPVWW